MLKKQGFSLSTGTLDKKIVWVYNTRGLRKGFYMPKSLRLTYALFKTQDPDELSRLGQKGVRAKKARKAVKLAEKNRETARSAADMQEKLHAGNEDICPID
jgi:hypothetical protein